MPLTVTALALASAMTAPVSASGSTSVSAPEASPPAGTQPADTSQTVIVRGQRTPAARASFTATVVDRPGSLPALDELPARVPGLWLVNDQDPGTNILSIRAATTDRLQQASVAMLVDGVALADTEFFTGPLLDVTGITVLKGPQGALFGKNAAGGAVLIRTGDPGDPGRLALTLGDGGLRRIEAAAGAGTAGTALSGRIAALHARHDGWITNRTLNRLVDGQELTALRLTGAVRPAADWTLTGRLFTMEERGGAAWASSGNVTGRAGGRLDGAILTDPIGDYEGRAWRRWTQGSLSAVRDLPGAGEVRLLVARDRYAKRWREELDYRPGPLTFFGLPLFPQGLQPISQPVDLAVWTAEASLRSRLGGWTVTVGAFGQDTDRFRIDDFGPLLFGGPALSYATGSRQLAVFGAAHWTGRALTVDLEARRDTDRRSQTIGDTASGRTVERRAASFARTQPRIGFSLDLAALSPGRMAGLPVLYGSASEAFRPGGFNPAPGPLSIWQPTFRPEVTRAVELGLRARAWSLSVFRNAVSDFQTYTFLDGQSVTLSVPDVTVDGAEISGRTPVWRAGRWSGSLSGGAAWNRARLGRFVATDPLLGSPATRDFSGAPVPNAPEWTGTVAADLRWTGWRAAAVETRLQLHGAGRTVYELDAVLVSPERTWLDLSVSLQPGPQAGVLAHWRIGLDVRNLTDRRWAVSAFGQGMVGLLAGLGPGGPFDTFTINRGRQVSVGLERTF